MNSTMEGNNRNMKYGQSRFLSNDQQGLFVIIMNGLVLSIIDIVVVQV